MFWVAKRRFRNLTVVKQVEKSTNVYIFWGEKRIAETTCTVAPGQHGRKSITSIYHMALLDGGCDPTCYTTNSLWHRQANTSVVPSTCNPLWYKMFAYLSPVSCKLSILQQVCLPYLDYIFRISNLRICFWNNNERGPLLNWLMGVLRYITEKVLAEVRVKN